MPYRTCPHHDSSQRNLCRQLLQAHLIPPVHTLFENREMFWVCHNVFDKAEIKMSLRAATRRSNLSISYLKDCFVTEQSPPCGKSVPCNDIHPSSFICRLQRQRWNHIQLPAASLAIFPMPTRRRRNHRAVIHAQFDRRNNHRNFGAF